MLLAFAVLLGGCRSQQAASQRSAVDSLDRASVTPRDSSDSVLLKPRVVTGPTVLVFWLPAADTLPADDQASALDELTYYTDRIAPALAQHNITLLPTNGETVYVALPNNKQRVILLSGVDYPFGYVLVEPGTAERILAGVYGDDELIDELEAYFDVTLTADSSAARPRVST